MRNVQKILLAAALLAANTGFAAIQKHSFTMSGSGGDGVDPFAFALSTGSGRAELAITSGTTVATPVPALPLGALAGLVGLLGLFGFRRLRK